MVTSIEFFNTWKSLALGHKRQLTHAWDNCKQYTSIILNGQDCFLAKVAKELGLLAYTRGYYSIDGILYSTKDLIPECPKDQLWLRSIPIAFEHKNNFRNIHQEIAHLLITRADLYVIVTYPPEISEKHIDKFHQIFDGCSHVSELDEKENFLIILGKIDPFEWKGYVYKTKGWKPLEV
jgi:hypothetical protein